MKNISNQNIVFKDKKVLLRVDLNVPMKNGSITELSRIEKIIPTIKLLLEKKAKIIIMINDKIVIKYFLFLIKKFFIFSILVFVSIIDISSSILNHIS